MSEWHKLDKLIYDAEKAEEIKKRKAEEQLEQYFDQKHRELAKKDIKDLDWNELHLLSDLQKQDEEPLAVTEPLLNYFEEYKRRQGMHQEQAAQWETTVQKDNDDELLDTDTPHELCNKLIDDIILRSPQLKEPMMKVKELLNSINHTESEPQTGNDEVEIGQDRTVVETVGKHLDSYWNSLSDHQKNVHNLRILQADLSEIISLNIQPSDEIKKQIDTLGKILNICNEEPNKEKEFLLKCDIQKSDNMHIRGIASCDIIDSQGDRIGVEVLKSAMPAYIKRNSMIMLQHSARPVGRVVKHSFVKHKGNDALFIEAEIFDKDIYDQVGSKYHGFSIGGQTTMRKDKCDTIKCWKEIHDLDLWEISLCERGSNAEAVITGKS